MKIGDKVRFLFETGGGIVKGFQGKDIALVEDENGFRIPMLIRECVVIDTNEYNFEKRTVAPKEGDFRPRKTKKVFLNLSRLHLRCPSHPSLGGAGGRLPTAQWSVAKVRSLMWL